MARAHRETLKKRPQPPAIAPADRRPTGPKVQPLIPMPPQASFGPAMMALPTDAQRAFVIGLVIYGLSQIEAGRQAGFSARSPHALDVQSSRLAHDDRIQAAILEEGQRLMRTQGPKSIHTLVAIRDSKTASDKDRMAAAKDLLDRSGFHAISEQKVSVEHSLSDAEVDRRLAAIFAARGLDPAEGAKLLSDPAKGKDIIDAEYSEVEPAREPTPEEIAAQRVRDHENEMRNRRRAMSPEELAAHKAQKRQERSERAKLKHQAALYGDLGIEDLL